MTEYERPHYRRLDDGSVISYRREYRRSVETATVGHRLSGRQGVRMRKNIARSLRKLAQTEKGMDHGIV